MTVGGLVLTWSMSCTIDALKLFGFNTGHFSFDTWIDSRLAATALNGSLVFPELPTASVGSIHETTTVMDNWGAFGNPAINHL